MNSTPIPLEEREDFIGAVRDFLASRAPLSSMRDSIEQPRGFDPDVWQQMAEQLALQGLVVDEDHGGSGFSQVELDAVFEALGYELFPGPFLSTVGMAVPALSEVGGDAAGEILAAIAAGEQVVALAASILPEGVGIDPSAFEAKESGGDWQLSGATGFVIDGDIADVILVPARAGGTTSLFAVDPSATSAEVRRREALDPTRRLAEVKLAGTPATLIGEDAEAALARALDRALASLAAEQVGVAQRALDMTVEYALDRQQFERPIGSFQAVKHHCADVLLSVESARSAALNASDVVTAGGEDVSFAASVAKCRATEAAYQATATMIQIHGGIGYTWEHDAHFLFKRARSSSALLGTADAHHDRVAELKGF